MSMKHVYDLIGPPTDTRSFITGKAFNPFYFGTDNARTVALYKGEGRLTFSSRGQLPLINIEYDPNETGYGGR